MFELIHEKNPQEKSKPKNVWNKSLRWKNERWLILSSVNKCEDEIISMSRAWDKEKIWLPNIWFEPMTSQTRGGRSTTELRRTQGERGHILGSYLTRVLHAARISNVEVVLYSEWMKDGKFKLFIS